jgi:3-hydroxybutyryl-CoA dehydrogenase
MAALPSDCPVAVIGSGAMGAGIAQIAAACGHRVQIYDSNPSAAEKALANINSAYARLADKGRLSAEDAAAAGRRLQRASSLADLAGAALVIEAIAEDLGAKRTLFAQLEAVVGDDCVLATNTSSISVTAIAAGLRRPQRLVGMHFFNPAPAMALVEVVSGLATDAAVAATVFDTAAAWDKKPVHATSTPGFIVNRVARPFYAEALRLLTEGAADAATLDAVMREAGGFRMGPFELMDLIGHDVNFAVTQSVFEAHFGDRRFMPSVMQRELVNAGFLGRKSGRGFYRYGDDAVQNSAPRSEASFAFPEFVSYGSGPCAGSTAKGGITAAMAERLRAAGIAIQARVVLDGAHGHGHGHGNAPAFHCNGAAVHLSDGRSATQRARDEGHPDIVLFDLAFDYATAPRIAVACADQCNPAAYHAVVGMFQAAGFAVTRLDDVPGLIVMRTVAMLANEAADAVHQGVCSIEAVDTAMQKGVNYPRGPLAWADAVGLPQIVAVLDHLAAAYGEERYRVSPLLRRKLAAGGRFY